MAMTHSRSHGLPRWIWRAIGAAFAGVVVITAIAAPPSSPPAAANLQDPVDPARPPLQLLTFLEPPLVDEANGQLVGPVIDIITEVLREAGEPYELKVLPAKRALLVAQTRINHCVLPVERSQEREATLRWISPILISRHGLYSLPRSRFHLRSLEDARVRQLSSHLGSGVGEYLELQGFKVNLVTTPEQALSMLAVGRVDLWISDTYSARHLQASEGIDLGEPELVFLTTLRGMGCHPETDPVRLKRLQASLARLYDNGTMKARLGFDIQNH